MLKIILALGLAVAHAVPEGKEHYTSVARDKAGKTSYFERHEVDFAKGGVQTAKTVYLNQDQKVIAEMSSDFRKTLTTPEYDYQDLRNNSSHGLKIEGDSIVLWRQESGKAREEKRIDKSKFDSETLLVGCQGLHYYLISNLEEIRSRKKLPIKYMMPGALDYYSFTLKVKSEDEKFIHLRLTIDNVILKMFTSALEMTYRKSDRRLTFYSGISNLVDDQGDMQVVTIDYKYE